MQIRRYTAQSSVVAIGLTSIAALFTPPQLLIALAGGFLFRAIARLRVLAPDLIRLPSPKT